jgi:hypothetical protein
MVSIRTARNKGSSFEMDVEYSLQQVYPDLFRTKAKGYITQYDHISEKGQIVIECKRLRGISWNALIGFYTKLKKVAPHNYVCCVLFKSNFQPCLVFDGMSIHTFEYVFGHEFKKHPSTKVNNNDIK